MKIRSATPDDLAGVLALYTHLRGEAQPHVDADWQQLWHNILVQSGHYVLLGCKGDLPVCSCVLAIVQNLSHGGRPYALIENVVTHTAYRRQGFAGRLLAHAIHTARENNCYKIMLLTGTKDAFVLHMYEKAGFNRQDKTAFIRWL